MLQSCLQHGALLKHHWAENRLNDFNLWDASVGASARPSNSLDIRLQSDASARKVILGALDTLAAWVTKCKQLCTNADMDAIRPRDLLPPNSSIAVDQSHETDITIDEAKQSVEELCNILVEMAAAIRHAGTDSRLQRADRTFWKRASRHEEFEKHLKIILQLPNFLISRRQKDRQLELDLTNLPSSSTEISQQSLALTFEQRILLEKPKASGPLRFCWTTLG